MVAWLAHAASARAAELQVPSRGARAALAVALDDGGLWYAACAATPCDARAGQRLELPAPARSAVASAALAELALEGELRVAHVRVPISPDVAWEALVVAPLAGARAPVPFAGLTGLVEGEDGQRTGDVVWIRSDDKGQRVLLGRAREDVQLCGRPTLLPTARGAVAK